MAAHDVFKAIAPQVDGDFLALDILPILWQFSLGPLLNLTQFQAYMNLIKSTSARVEHEQTRKLQELGANSTSATTRNEFMSFGGPPVSNGLDSSNGGDDTNFEALVRGGQGSTGTSDMLGGDPWGGNASASSSTILPSRPANRSNNASPAPATFSWSTPPVSPPPQTNLSAPHGNNKAITPTNNFSSLNQSFPAMSPANPGIGSPSFPQPQTTLSHQPAIAPSYTPSPSSTGIDWSKANSSSASAWGTSTSSTTTNNNSFPSGLSGFSAMQPSQPLSQPIRQNNAASPYSGFSIAPPPVKQQSAGGTFSIAPPPMLGAGGRGASMNSLNSMKGGSGSGMAGVRKQTQTQTQSQQGQGQMNWGSGGDSLI